MKKADEYFTKAGWGERGPDGIRVKDGKRLSIRMSSGISHHKDRMVIVKEEAKKAGLEINLQIIDSAAAFNKFRTGEVSHVSSGGGASLVLIEGKELIGLSFHP